MEPTVALTTAIDNANKVANTPLFTTIIDKLTGFKISEWAAQGELRKKLIHDEYEKAKGNGIVGIQYIKNIRETTNLIDTAVKSSKYIDPEKSNEVEMDNDFFWNVIEHSKSVSNDEMQELIAKIIAEEYNKQGTYSMSTLACLKTLGKAELNLIEKVATLSINNFQIPKEIFNLPESIKKLMSELMIDFGTLQSLQCLGLILPNEMTQITQNPSGDSFALTYFDKRIVYKPSNDTVKTITFPSCYEFSINGQQILKHLNPVYNENYFIWLKENYKLSNYEIQVV
jgi:Protein of unknown function (DUF2806)